MGVGTGGHGSQGFPQEFLMCMKEIIYKVFCTVLDISLLYNTLVGYKVRT